MYQGKSILGLIPARGGSKGLPGKNIKKLGDKPLIAWTIEAAQNSSYLDQFILSSDCKEIISVAQNYGCEVPFTRPSELATDESSTLDVVLHALKYFPDYDYLVILQPTSPLRASDDIDRSIEKCIDQKAESVFSVCEATEHPNLMFRVDSQKGELIKNADGEMSRRQDLSQLYVLNGAVYVLNINQLLKNKSFLMENNLAYIMPKLRSVDIDDIIDFKFAEVLLSEKEL